MAGMIKAHLAYTNLRLSVSCSRPTLRGARVPWPHIPGQISTTKIILEYFIVDDISLLNLMKAVFAALHGSSCKYHLWGSPIVGFDDANSERAINLFNNTITVHC